MDASAVVKVYVRESGSDRVRAILDRGEDFYLSRVGIVEVAAAIFGKTKTGELEAGQAASAVALLREDLDVVYQVIELDAVTAERGVRAAEHHKLRAYECMQLASALFLHEQRASFELAPLILVSSDAELNAAAENEGLNVEDPAG